MGRLVRWIVGGFLTTAVAVVTMLAWLWCRTDDRVREIPLSQASSRGRVGADWAERNGYAGDPVEGEIDDFGAFARLDFDPASIDPEVRRFYERTADYEMAYDVEWHRGFRVGAWLASFATTWLEQLNLPARSGAGVRHLESDLAAVPREIDPRGSVVWTRTDPASGDAVFVAVYSTHGHRGVTYANVAVPLPWTNLSTVLRPDAIETAGETDGVAFTTAGPDDGGLCLVTPMGPLALPMSQSFRVWPAGAADGEAVVTAPGARDVESPIDDADLVATHEMWLRGRQFLTIRYGIRRENAG